MERVYHKYTTSHGSMIEFATNTLFNHPILTLTVTETERDNVVILIFYNRRFDITHRVCLEEQPSNMSITDQQRSLREMMRVFVTDNFESESSDDEEDPMGAMGC